MYSLAEEEQFPDGRNWSKIETKIKKKIGHYSYNYPVQILLLLLRILSPFAEGLPSGESRLGTKNIAWN